MPRIGMEPVRRKALIDAAIEAIHQEGMAHITMGTIAKRAGVSAGLAHHYFGGKDKLLLATMRHLLSELGEEMQRCLKNAATPRARISAIIAGNFSAAQFRPAVISAWLAFYEAAQTEPEARRLLRVYTRRLESNLLHALQELVAREEAVRIAETVASLIDGVWIRRSLAGPADPDGAAALLEDAVDALLLRKHPHA
ncbi:MULTISPECIES: transcriptional regulator BetI [Hyphomicrobiales]|uniref:HTH-type transcriptional regulator BetI n=2 Tax=Hyphomicrobiales TaxID=356 RepID=A0A1G5NQP8_AFIMA|nr:MULTISPECIES: transcriptional regulator BetI [Hyphomicrobiales]MBK1624678.1 transcriptional regulator BetI [Afifella marina DSM 2698]MBK1627385.1 transcriptional regulator BetI [Afifella marina]MBK5915849.1 transcriptional regulator BetI [Afifella marina]MDQ0325635.1 TetR/AcrR family transcriptional repressor of bet genes [Rhodopseudomonas julia]RAI20607.1 transcriptional regulator BetI [Afifella marina DSM 2698]